MFYTTYEVSRYTNMRLILELNIETERMDFSLVIFFSKSRTICYTLGLQQLIQLGTCKRDSKLSSYADQVDRFYS